MADNLFAFMYWAMGDGLAAHRWPRPGSELVTGGSPRYQIYRTLDDRFIAAAPLEERFWQTFCEAIGLPAAARNDSQDPATVKRAVAERIRSRTSDEWRGIFSGKDLCCNVMRTVDEAIADPEFIARHLFDAQLVAGVDRIAALPLPIAPPFRNVGSAAGYPALGEANALLGGGAEGSPLR
jgi:crotonobetainyl-CoA:carnitine CoA-transferase CaiB-like acyl-CoA transferase